jgi:demethylmenaquinone methyltransferase/2-methoxy-6-polyprenyl-1,4-benzoquinol methylase
MNTSNPSKDEPDALPPHKPLREYYGKDEARQQWVNAIFDETAQHYDWICRVMSFGSGSWYRRDALQRLGLVPGMKLLDVATGTGGVAAGGAKILGGAGLVVGLDPSHGMLAQCRQNGIPAALVQGRAEVLPFPDGHFDRLSMGYALRHVADLGVTFREYLRVLRPGGRVLILEISRPRSRFSMWFLRVYMNAVVPLVTRFGTGSVQAEKLMRYYWETISGCVPPETILAALRGAGFTDVARKVKGGILSEYVGTRP